MAADIETLIRQALARQNGFDPQVRAKIYQSSRNALAKMIAKSGLVPPDIIEARNRSLEDTISKIDQEFTANVSQENDSQPETTQQNEPSGIFQTPSFEPTAPALPPVSIPDTFDPGGYSKESQTPNVSDTPIQVSPPVVSATSPVTTTKAASTPEMETASQFFEPANSEPVPLPQTQVEGQLDYAEPTPQFARPQRKPFRYVIWITALAIFIIVGWIAFTITLKFMEPDPVNPVNGQTSGSNGSDTQGNFVTILEPDQPSALVTNGNGSAKILSGSSQPAIRIMSLRQDDNRAAPAEPMLLELAPGILKNIAGKKVTVEIFAKSGDSGPATFSVTCSFGSLGECGRKRFRIGLQPEAVIFSIQISKDYQEGQRAFLAINTDVTSAAAISGKGAQIDIVYARIKTNNGN